MGWITRNFVDYRDLGIIAATPAFARHLHRVPLASQKHSPEA